MKQPSPSVADALARTGARLERAGTVGRGISLAEWSNRGSETHYDRPGHHTLSVYLTGGERVVREDLRLSGGAPDKLCLLPAGHESRWHVGGPVRTFHLYLEHEALAYRALTAFDVDPRRIDLRDTTFSDDPAMAAIVRGAVLPLDWTEPGEHSALDAACHVLVHRLLRQYVDRDGAVGGGLSPATRARIGDLIEAHLGETLTLDRMAEEARLSTFHFAKMFRVSFGLPPHRYIGARRIERAKLLLRLKELALANIALSCGFSSQSHFTRAFKSATSMTPGEWRRGQRLQ